MQTLESQSFAEYEDRSFAETPFMEPRAPVSQEEPARESPTPGEASYAEATFESPFLPSEVFAVGEAQAAAPELAALAEINTDLKDSAFREALEHLADEALEAHADQLAGEYGDRETRDTAAEQLLTDHFAPLAAQAEGMLDQFFERLESYEAEALTDTEIERIAGEVVPSQPLSPASKQFLGGLLRKAGKLVSGAVRLARSGVEGAVKLAGKGLAAIGKLALGPLLRALKQLAVFLLRHVVRYALGHLPPQLQPLAQKLADRLFRAIGETHEAEFEDHEQTEAEVVPATTDVARLEAEFDVAAAQLLLVPDEAEVDRLVAGYGEGEPSFRPLPELDAARAGLQRELERLEPGQSAQPVMEQFLPAVIWPAAKTAISLIGRPRLVEYLGRLLSGLIRPMIGVDAAGQLAPAIADAGLRIFGLEAEAGPSDPRALATEALAATIEETINAIGELPQYVLDHETLLESAVRDAFEDAAATYFPSSLIKSELRETAEQPGMWARMPLNSPRKRYARYSQSLPVTITPRVANSLPTFGGATLGDHIRDRMDVPRGRALKTNVRLYQALPGTTASAIARAEGIPAYDLHPLTPQAAGALLGPNAGLGSRPTPAAYLASPHRLHVRQRLYYLEPPGGRHVRGRPNARLARSEVLLNLRRGEVRVWLYLSEPLCQQVSAELAKAGNAAGAFRLVRPLVLRSAELVRAALLERHLPPALRLVGEAPNLERRVPGWLRERGGQLAAKVAEWASEQVAQYLRNNGEEFRRVSASHQDGVTLRITMSRVPGLDSLRLAAHGARPGSRDGLGWPGGQPAFAVVALPGYAIA